MWKMVFDTFYGFKVSGVRVRSDIQTRTEPSDERAMAEHVYECRT
jgi:hypothetical protein